MPPRLNNFIPYLRYKRLETVPLGMGAFERTNANEVLVNFGELRCRVDEGGELCGAVYQSRGALCTHLERAHGEQVAQADNNGNPGAAYIQDIKGKWNIFRTDWYRAVMQEHDRLVAEGDNDNDNDDDDGDDDDGDGDDGDDDDDDDDDDNGGGGGDDEEEEWQGFDD